MSKKDKLLEKINNNPKVIRFNEIDKILKTVGFTCKQAGSGSSHYVYSLDELVISIPYKKPYVKEYYIKQVIILLDKLGY